MRDRVGAEGNSGTTPSDDGGWRYGPDMQSRDVLGEIGARLTAAVPPRSRVLLFGSRARDEAVDGSDFDILVIEPQVADAAKESVRLRRELRGLGVPIDVVVVDEATAARRRAVEAQWSSAPCARDGCLSTPEHREVALLLLAKARADLAAARLLASDPQQDDGVIGFHARQTAEKALKAAIAHQESELPRTHDLEYLLELLKAGGDDSLASLEELAWLNPWAVTMRYDEQEAPLDRSGALESAEAALGRAESRVRPHG